MDLVSAFLSKPFLIIQLLACIAAIYFWKHYKNTYLWVFLPLMLYTLLNEILVQYLIMKDMNPGRLLYNLYSVISFLIYLYWFDKILKLEYWKWIILLVFLAVSGYDYSLHGFQRQFFKTGLTVQSIFLLSFSVIYYMRLLKDDKIINYMRIPEFWFILGLLTFYIAFTPLQLVTGLGLDIGKAYYIAIVILNFILYGCYIIGFYATSRK